MPATVEEITTGYVAFPERVGVLELPLRDRSWSSNRRAERRRTTSVPWRDAVAEPDDAVG
jgi:hypothetical protein